MQMPCCPASQRVTWHVGSVDGRWQPGACQTDHLVGAPCLSKAATGCLACCAPLTTAMLRQRWFFTWVLGWLSPRGREPAVQQAPCYSCMWLPLLCSTARVLHSLQAASAGRCSRPCCFHCKCLAGCLPWGCPAPPWRGRTSTPCLLCCCTCTHRCIPQHPGMFSCGRHNAQRDGLRRLRRLLGTSSQLSLR
jgi:hypothetical protein